MFDDKRERIAGFADVGPQAGGHARRVPTGNDRSPKPPATLIGGATIEDPALQEDLSMNVK
jgi:hypothetical protein